MNLKSILFSLIIATAALPAYTQSLLKPGDPAIKMEFLKSSHDFYRNIITDTAGKVMYDFMMENTCIIDTLQKCVTFARFRQVPPGSFSTDTSITDFFFRPIRMHELHHQRNVSFEMTFDSAKAVVKTFRNGVASSKSYPMETGYFEDNMIEYIFGCLQLKKGQTYLLNNFNPSTSGNDPYSIMYSFDDIWNPAADIKINCTVLYFIHGPTTGYIWIDKSSHKVLKEIGENKGYSFILTKQ